jgi:hypothetical protein
VDVVRPNVGSERIDGKNQRRVATTGSKDEMVGFGLRYCSGEQGRISVIAYGATEVFRHTRQCALERSAGLRRLDSSRDAAVE